MLPTIRQLEINCRIFNVLIGIFDMCETCCSLLFEISIASSQGLPSLLLFFRCEKVDIVLGIVLYMRLRFWLSLHMKILMLIAPEEIHNNKS